MKKRADAGFTLIEALVLVAVLGILVAITVPNYSRYVTRGYLIEAGDALSEFRVRMEQFHRDHRTYAKSGACGHATPAPLNAFSVACALTAGGQAFTATATGTGTATGFVYTINQDNERVTLAMPSHWGELPADARTKWVTR